MWRWLLGFVVATAGCATLQGVDTDFKVSVPSRPDTDTDVRDTDTDTDAP